MSNYTVKPCNFQLDNQSFIHCYFLLVLMPEPVLYIWLVGDANFAFDTHSPHFASHRDKFQTQHRIFLTKLLNFCLRLIDHWSRQKRPLWGWEMATDLSTSSPGSFVHHAFWKRESVGNRRLVPQAKLLLALLKRSGPSVTKHYRKSSHSWTKKIFELKALCFNRASSILTWGESRVLLNERAGGVGR